MDSLRGLYGLNDTKEVLVQLLMYSLYSNM